MSLQNKVKLKKNIALFFYIRRVPWCSVRQIGFALFC